MNRETKSENGYGICAGDERIKELRILKFGAGDWEEVLESSISGSLTCFSTDIGVIYVKNIYIYRTLIGWEREMEFGSGAEVGAVVAFGASGHANIYI